jgi:hypothetical protein
MSGGEDASFSGFQFFAPSRTADAATQPFPMRFNAFRAISGRREMRPWGGAKT